MISHLILTFFLYSIDGYGTLTCPDAQPTDQGAYSCESINIKGSVFAVPDTIVVGVYKFCFTWVTSYTRYVMPPVNSTVNVSRPILISIVKMRHNHTYSMNRVLSVTVTGVTIIHSLCEVT